MFQFQFHLFQFAITSLQVFLCVPVLKFKFQKFLTRRMLASSFTFLVSRRSVQVHFQVFQFMFIVFNILASPFTLLVSNSLSSSVPVHVPSVLDFSVLVHASCATSVSSSSSSSVSAHVPSVQGSCVAVVASHDKSVSFSGPVCDMDFVSLHERVRTSGLPNYVACHLPVPSRLNIPLWRQYLQECHDAKICDFLEFGWPVGYDYATHGFPVSQLRNHQGALLFLAAIDSYLQNEICRNVVLGPFESNPFSCTVALSPLNFVPKHDSRSIRLSWTSVGWLVHQSTMPFSLRVIWEKRFLSCNGSHAMHVWL